MSDRAKLQTAWLSVSSKEWTNLPGTSRCLIHEERGKRESREALGTQGSKETEALGWPGVSPWQCSVLLEERKGEGGGRDKDTKELEGAWFPSGPMGSLLISKRRAKQSMATCKVKGQQGNSRCQQAKGQFRERAVGGLLCLWVSLISEPLWPGTELWVPTGSCLFKQN